MRKMGIGLGVGINRSNYAQGIFNAYSARVVADGGVVESGACVDAVSSLLQQASFLLIPSGYKGGKLYSEIPTNGNGDLTWTRASDAWRTNADGLIQRVPWNLVQYSEQFDNAYWIKSGSSVTANTTTAPNGTTTADSIIENTSNSTHLSYNASAISAISGAYTFSVYMKKNTRTHGFVQIATDTASKRYTIVVDLNSGSVTSTTSSGSPINPSNTITNVGDEWYRISVTATNTSGGLYGIFGLSDSATPTYTATAEPTYTGNGTSGIFIWGAQLVEGTTAQTYLPTTDRLNFPRLSYMYGSCPALLLEPQRTNLALRSEEFDNASWTKSNTSVTANATTSPDGTSNADKLIVNNGVSIDGSHVQQAITKSAASITYSYTCYAKASELNAIRILARDSISVLNSAQVYYNINNGSVITAATAGGTFSAASSTITSVANGFYRINLTFKSSLDTQLQLRIYPYDTVKTTGNGTDGIIIYGAQLELGAYPTTYIPTTSATATRVADSFSRNNIYTNGLISASGGTWFVSLVNNVAMVGDAGGEAIVLGDIASTAGNNFRLYNPPSSSRMQIFKTVSSGATPIYTTTSDTVKIAIKWNGTTADVFANGTKVVSATSFTTTAMEYFWTNITGVPKFIQQMALFNSPLTDAQCQTLTT